MPTQTQFPPVLEEALYSPETINRWNQEYEETMSRYANGEIQPMSAAEYAAKKGIALDD